MTSYGTTLSEFENSSSRPTRFLDLVAPKLQMVEDELRRNFVSPIRTINEVGEHIMDGGGKRLRPLLLLLCADMAGYKGTRDVTYGVVVEFIHTATLIHDDIIDEAAVRRGKTSINYQWGNHLTVLVGDFVYMHAMSIALAEGDLDILRLLSDITLRMTEGEILALEKNGRTDLTLDDYFEIVVRKTAALFAGTCRIAGHLVDLPEASRKALFDYGHNLGVCFQLIDDLLDFTSSTEVLGKPVVSDLKEGKLTLPLILALLHATDDERRLVERIASDRSLGSASPADVIAIANKHGGIAETRKIAREYAARARAALATFAPSPAREALEFALEFVMSRDR